VPALDSGVCPARHHRAGRGAANEGAAPLHGGKAGLHDKRTDSRFRWHRI